MSALFVIMLLIVGAIAFAISLYNGLRSRSEKVKRGQSDLLGEMKKRAALANQLVEICKGFGDHEKLTHVTVSNNTVAASDAAHLARATNTVLAGVGMVAERFPDLKADQTYLKLMAQLQTIENELQIKRETLNREVEVYNTQRASFPAVLFADKMGFPEAPYFSTDADGLDNIQTFKTDDGAMLRDQMNRLGATVTATVVTTSKRAGEALAAARAGAAAPMLDAALGASQTGAVAAALAPAGEQPAPSAAAVANAGDAPADGASAEGGTGTGEEKPKSRKKRAQVAKAEADAAEPAAEPATSDPVQ